MNRATQNRNLLLYCVAVVAWLGFWSFAPAARQLDSKVIHWSLGGGLALAAISAAVLAYVLAKRSSEARRYFEELNRLELVDLIEDGVAQRLPKISRGNPWSLLAKTWTSDLCEQAYRLQQAENARTNLEVRWRKNIAKQQQIETILQSLSEPVLVVDQYDELLLTNPSAERLFKLPQEDVSKRALDSLERCDALIELLHETRRRKGPGTRTAEVQLVDPEGEARWYNVTAKAIASTDNQQRDGAMAILRDISHVKIGQKKNAEFVSAVSHEMKTPLAGIKAYVELLADGEADDPESREEFLEVINSQADRLQRLIDNLLNLARIEAGVVEVSKKARSLNELLEEALGIVRPAAEAKQITLTSDLSGMYLGVLADRDMMLQAAINLLSNAIKYTQPGGKVTLRSRLVDEQVQFEVEDTGVGLSPEDADRIFEKFYRVKKDSSMAPGTGLGLALAKHIVEDAHGGQLTVRSVLGTGSTFAISLPCAAQMN